MSETIIPENISSEPAHLNQPARNDFFLIFVKVLITVMFMFPLAHYSIYGGDKRLDIQIDENQTGKINTTITLQETIITPNKTTKIKMRIVMPPSCKPLDIPETLKQLCDDYIFESTFCTPEDFENQKKHKIPINAARQNAPNDPRTSIVSYVTVGFLLVSLSAAFLELYKAKKQVPAKAKAPLSRKCSLADLTIMKHHRKELIRRDSILESPEESRQPAHYKKAPPLQRSSSTPAEPISEFLAYNFSRSFDSRRGSVIEPQTFTSYPISDPTCTRYTLEGRRGSILDRRASIIDGKLLDRFDSSGRRISIDITSSPERKHHSRLVHRH